MKRFGKYLLSLFVLLVSLTIFTGCEDKKQDTKPVEDKKISVNLVIVNDKTELYNETLKTESKTVFDLLKEANVDMKYEDSDYGAYVTALKGVEGKTTKKEYYYWAFYIDDEMASTGVSSTNLENGKTYKFVYEHSKK